MQNSEAYKSLATFASPEFMDFIAQAFKEDPSLFRKEDNDQIPNYVNLYATLKTVFSAWERLNFMLESKQKWTEADYSNV